ncbi:MAG: glycosyltransferase family 4 protein, partial [Pseudomonadota bacterium]|nr:glycosyltransferase family 4 protein [Pseudomonadota bacterium]
GPHCPGLLQHLAESRARYDVVIFFAAIYEPAAVGLPLWGRRSILVPLLHDEKAMYLPQHHRSFHGAGAILFNAPAERRLAARLYGGALGGQPIVGVGVDIQQPPPATVDATLARFGLARGYFIYVGRVDPGKGCQVLIDALRRHWRDDPTARLVLVGGAVMALPDDPRIIATGFVDDADRNALIAAATALVIPSRYESLSLVLLEAMRLGTPVIANDACEVLADHVALSGAGIAYRGQRGLRHALEQVAAMGAADRARMTAAGAAYVSSRYTWDAVGAAYEQAIATVCALPCD